MTTPPPFTLHANRLHRICDEQFAAVMLGDHATVRMIGPRRTGKTNLVSSYGRTAKAPVLVITLHPSPASPGVLIEARILDALATLEHEAPKLYRAFQRIAPEPVKRRMELSANMPIPGLDPLAIGGTATYEQEPIASEAKRTAEDESLGRIGVLLRNLGLAARAAKCRPVIFFDEIQEALARDTPDSAPGLAAIWAIRNEAQHHTACRFVFAGSNQRLFNTLSTGAAAPLLNFGTAIRIAPLTPPQVDEWALPFFQAARIHIRTLTPLCNLLCGKIGELDDVLTQLWLTSNPEDVIDESAMFGAVRSVASNHSLPEFDDLLRQLGAPQSTILRWMLTHPAQSPYTRASVADLGIPVGTVRTAVTALVTKGHLEDFDGQLMVASPLRVLSAFR